VDGHPGPDATVIVVVGLDQDRVQTQNQPMEEAIVMGTQLEGAIHIPVLLTVDGHPGPDATVDVVVGLDQDRVQTQDQPMEEAIVMGLRVERAIHMAVQGQEDIVSLPTRW